ncbi:toprim domain-containing protein [Halothiobacillus sp.]|uniref:toprim domain-containing protein n=1 Tax=Halothiobacillus sp. TaxID=1891311 RepID=UPI002AD28F00|nr:toprim domain-containing protein [Halothiobacillus sp.]
MTTAERAEHHHRMDDARRQRAELERHNHEQAAIRAKSIFAPATLASDTHLYLVKKGISAGIAKQSRGALVLPIVSFDNKLASLQFIQPDGSKRLLSGGAKRGNYIPAGGNVMEPSRVIICEGWATGRTLSELDPAALIMAAIDAGNLQAVAMNARAKWPHLPLVIAGDDDRLTDGNPGRTKANAAAITSGASLMFPQWGDDMPQSLSDWNDWRQWMRTNGGGS